jgi:hypothetical protein
MVGQVRHRQRRTRFVRPFGEDRADDRGPQSAAAASPGAITCANSRVGPPESAPENVGRLGHERKRAVSVWQVGPGVSGSLHIAQQSGCGERWAGTLEFGPC